MSQVELSVVIPVFNSSVSIVEIVDRTHKALEAISHEIILVDDDSVDESAWILQRLSSEYDGCVSFLILSRNYGKHTAVFAGLNRSRGDYVAVLDDEGDYPPEELPRMLCVLKLNRLDVVYGKHCVPMQSRIHRWGSRLTDILACRLLGKPSDLFLSSFKVMSRFVVDQLTRYPPPYSYLDGRILQITNRLGQVEVLHHPRRLGASGYTFAKLVAQYGNVLFAAATTHSRISRLAVRAHRLSVQCD
jgi:undecaprenyl-phosphate 4-deoxy-4-formamido-L-arabinose transferase